MANVHEEIVRYPMRSNKENPLFTYLVKKYDVLDYYLFEDFDSALECAKKLYAKYSRRIDIHEYDFNTCDRQFRAQNTFYISYSGKVKYDKYAEVGLHLEFYVNAGEWMNPRQDWIDLIHQSWEREDAGKMVEE